MCPQILFGQECKGAGAKQGAFNITSVFLNSSSVWQPLTKCVLCQNVICSYNGKKTSVNLVLNFIIQEKYIKSKIMCSLHSLLVYDTSPCIFGISCLTLNQQDSPCLNSKHVIINQIENKLVNPLSFRIVATRVRKSSIKGSKTTVETVGS